MFAHEKLLVYHKALNFAAKVALWTGAWDKRHALVDHLGRAAESVLVNLADAAKHREVPGRLTIADYAIGSSLECAGCLDMAHIKGLLAQAQCGEEKSRLCEVTRMLIGLRKAWADPAMKEDSLPYRGQQPSNKPGTSLFHHEGLEVYQTALAFMGWFVAHAAPDALSKRAFRQIDEAATSIVLNIAEGNGRYAEVDHRRFLKMAQSGAVKAAVYVDLCVKAGLWTEADAAVGKGHLGRVNVLLAGF